MKTDNKLKQEVIELNNALLTWQIEHSGKKVSSKAMFNISGLYFDCGGSPLEAACAAEKAVSKIKDENKRLLICKQLLKGEIVKIPGMLGTFRLWGIFYDLKTGEKFNNEDFNEHKDPEIPSETAPVI